MIYIIPCGARKLPHRAPAAELYTGSYFKACLRWARACARPGDQVFILSALHGLVTLQTPLDPYDLKMTDRQAISFREVARQAADLGILTQRVTAVGGSAYLWALRAAWASYHQDAPFPDFIETPFAGLGLGRQLQALKRAAEEVA